MKKFSTRSKYYFLFPVSLFILLVSLSGCMTSKEYYEYDRGLPVYGYIENVMIETDDMLFAAKLDSGADTSSMNALDLTEFERDGDTWVRFHLIHPKTEEKIEIEKKVVRWASIKRHGAARQRRPVVLMTVKIGKNEYFREEFSLTDRSQFEYQVLLGRNYLNGIALIDVSQKNMAQTK